MVVEDLFPERETNALIDAVETGKHVAETTRAIQDAEGKSRGIAIWHDLGDDIWAAVSSCPRIVNTALLSSGDTPKNPCPTGSDD